MKCRNLSVVLNKDYSDNKSVLEALKAFLGRIDGLYFVTAYDNGFKYFMDIDELDNVTRSLSQGQYAVVCKSITEVKDFIVILKPRNTDSFRELDDKRITGMFEEKGD